MYLWHYEWKEIEALETENQRINNFRQEIHHVYGEMTGLSLLGESVLEWEDEDLEHYHIRRMAVDSMLCRFKTVYPARQIDSVRHLLESKERLLQGIVEVLDEQESLNQRIAERVPVIAARSAQEQPQKSKRKGFLGLFGKKEKPKTTATTNMLHALNSKEIAQQQAQSRRLAAQPLPATPKLVVTLTIDQLRTDYMEAFSTLYGEKGFKRLMREGKVFYQTEFPFNGTDRASAIAAIYSGTTPSMNGIISQYWMDASTLRPVNCVDDGAFMGNFTDENSSPSQLLTSTIADELKVATRNKGLVYAIAPSRDAAVLAAGHTGNGAFWLNENTGKWCSTTYYSEFPWWVSQYNERKSPDFRIRDMVWEPAHPINKYTFLPEWRDQPFKYKFDSERRNKFRRLLTSPFINDEVNLLTEELLEKSTIAKDEIPDLLALTYYAGNYNHKSTQECAMEMQDTYVRLDRSIAALLDLIDRKVGLHNVVFCITSTGYADPEAPDLGLYRIPGGEFYLNRCATLLNMYLMATYGEGQYVETYHNQQIYLNHKLIENKQLNLAEIQDKSADFLIQFSGVNEAYSAHRLLLGPWSPQIELARNSFHRKRSGDLLIDVLPGWTIVEENATDNRVVRHANVPAPLIFLGGGVKPETIRVPVNITRVAPTLSSVMRIRAPNACTETPLNF